MWQKSIILGAFLAAVVFLVGWALNLATMRVLVIRSLLTAAGSILAIVVAQKAIDTFTSTHGDVEAPLNDLNLGEFLDDEDVDSDVTEPEPKPAETESTEPEVDLDSDELQEDLEEQVEQGNEEGVEQIADLISDSMEEE